MIKQQQQVAGSPFVGDRLVVLLVNNANEIHGACACIATCLAYDTYMIIYRCKRKHVQTRRLVDVDN